MKEKLSLELDNNLSYVVMAALKDIIKEEKKIHIKKCEKYMEEYFIDFKNQELLIREVRSILKKDKWRKIKKFFWLK